MHERAYAITYRLTSSTGSYDEFTLAELLRAMAAETSPGEAWTGDDLRRLADTFHREG